MKSNTNISASWAALALSFAAACGQPDGNAAVDVNPIVPGTTPGDAVNPVPGMMDPAAASPTPPPAVCAESAKVQPRLYRLSTAQFGNAVRDLLQLPAAPTVIGDTEATLLFYPREDAPVQGSVAEGFSRASRDALLGLDLATLSGCSGVGSADAPNPESTACATRFLEDLASRAFRRPLDQEDRDALLVGPDSPFVVGNATGAATGISLTLEAILNAPSFVYRRELGSDSGRLSSLETAEQLGFLLLDSLPDDELWQAALADEMQTDEQIVAQVDRLLLKPDVRANVTRMVGAWFGADRVLQVSKDPTVFPGFNGNALQSAMFESLRLFIDDVLWNGTGDLSALLSSPRVYLNGPLAQALGVIFDGDNLNEFIPYDMPEQRAGILTQPALMAAFASSLETSIVKRGLFIVRRAMCLPAPPAPSAEIFALATAQASDLTQTEKQKAEFRNNPANPCSGCHGLIDPYGVVFENYDAVGRYRTALHSGQPVDPSTTMQELIVLPSEQREVDADFTEPVSDAIDFVQLMAQTDQFAFCADKQILSYAMGREVDESCVKEDLQSGVLQRDMTISDVIRHVVLDDLTRRRDSAGGL